MFPIEVIKNGKYEIEIVNRVVDNYGSFLQYSDTFVETGTCWGRSVQLALDAGYKEVRSVEASDHYFKEACNNFLNNPAVLLYHGMSVNTLPEMLKGVDKPCVIFLDAHVAGHTSAGYEDWLEKGEESDYAQDKILKAELHILLQHNPNHLIIIDDQNGWNEYTQGYLDIVLSYNPNYKFEFWDEQMGEMFYKNKMLICRT